MWLGQLAQLERFSLSSQSETAKLPQTTADQHLTRTRAKTPPRGLPPNEIDLSRRPPLSKEDTSEGG